MSPTEIEHVLAVAEGRGYLVIAEPFDSNSTEHVKLLEAWNTVCEDRGRHRVLVLNTGWGLWRTAIAFDAGADGEMQYLLHELEEAFRRHLDSAPRKEGDAWFASTQHLRRAEALAFELAAIDGEPRDAAFETVFVVNSL